MPTHQLRQQGPDGRRSRSRIDVVQNQQPSWIGLQPTDDRIALLSFIRLFPLREIQNRGAAKGSQVAVQRFGAVGLDEQHRRVVAGMAPSIFDGQSRLAHAAHAGQRLHRCRSVVAHQNRSEASTDVVEQGLSSFEQVAQACVAKMGHLPNQAGFDQDVEQTRAPDIGGKLVCRDKVNAGIAFDALQARQMGLLRSLLGRVEEIALIPFGAALRHSDQQSLAMIQRQPGFPLCIGEGWPTGLQKGGQRQTASEVRVAFSDHRYRWRLRHRTRHVAN